MPKATPSERAPSSDARQKPAVVRAGASRSAWAILVIVAALSVGIDLWSKDLAFERVGGDPVEIKRERVLELMPGRLDEVIVEQVGYPAPVVVVPHALEFKLVLNPGAVFGIGAGKRWFFIFFTAVAFSAVLWAFVKWTHANQRIVICGYAMIIGGGLGNLYDRLVYACVRDFLHPLPTATIPWSGGRPLWPYVSNIADALLLVGIGIIFVHVWRQDGHGRRAESIAGPEGDRPSPETPAPTANPTAKPVAKPTENPTPPSA